MLTILLACSLPANLLPAVTPATSPPAPAASSAAAAPTPAATPAAAAPSAPAATTGLPPARIYAALVSHNEEAPHPICTPVVTDSGTYGRNRAAVVELANGVVAHHAALDLQSDWAWAEAARQWDTAELKAQSGGKGIVEYLATLDPSRVVVDAHAHETTYNYADVATLLTSMGAPSNGVVGGFIYQPSEQEAWTKFRTELVGQKNPANRWRAQILWGAATFMHGGSDLRASGIWRPKDPEHFTDDDPSQSLVYVGTYQDGFSGIRELLDRLRQGELQAGHLYTATVFVQQCSLDSAGVSSILADVDSLAADVTAGNLVWAPIAQMVETWRRDYSSTPTMLLPLHASQADENRSKRRGPPGGQRPGGGPPGAGGPQGAGGPGAGLRPGAPGGVRERPTKPDHH